MSAIPNIGRSIWIKGIFILLVQILICRSAHSTGESNGFAGGSGTNEDPYLVETPGQLDKVRRHMDAVFKQIANIDLENYIEGQDWNPIGTSHRFFKGRFDGNGYEIKNLNIDNGDTSEVGLFRILGEGSKIKNVQLVEINVVGRSGGGLAGINYGTITNCHVGGTVIGNWGMGGLVGTNGGMRDEDKASIMNSSSSANVEVGVFFDKSKDVSNSSGTFDDSDDRGKNAGGLVGSNFGFITNSHSSGKINGKKYIGGLVGTNGWRGKITDSYATGKVQGKEGVGGLVGTDTMPENLIKNSYAEGNVTGQRCVGGLVGRYFGGGIVNSYALGNVEGTGRSIGGLVGSCTGSIVNSYASGRVNGHDWTGGLVGANTGGKIKESYASGKIHGEKNVGGLVGFNSPGKIFYSYAKGDVEGKDGVGGLVGANTDEKGTEDQRVGIIANSYSKGNVAGMRGVGGLLGRNGGQTIMCYAVGKVEGETEIGGLVGKNEFHLSERLHYKGKVSKSYFDKNTTGQEDTGKGIPRTTQEMMQKATFENWDFDNVWSIEERETYPFLHLRNKDTGMLEKLLIIVGSLSVLLLFVAWILKKRYRFILVQ